MKRSNANSGNKASAGVSVGIGTHSNNDKNSENVGDEQFEISIIEVSKRFMMML